MSTLVFNTGSTVTPERVYRNPDIHGHTRYKWCESNREGFIGNLDERQVQAIVSGLDDDPFP